MTGVVFATAKILIWKQFTTSNQDDDVSKSCVCNCKDTNLKAIHNKGVKSVKTSGVVFATAKILIWKQFTTNICYEYEQQMLCLQLQRY